MSQQIDLKPDQWMRLADGARRVGEPVWKFRRRMLALDEHHEGKLLRWVGRGKKRKHREVSAQALLFYQRVDIEAKDAEMAQVRAELEELRVRQEAQRNSFLAFRRKSLQWFESLGVRTRKDA
jgi:hypothetical protein